MFSIEYFLCSDLKFVAMICGIESVNSTNACVWCTCSASQRYDMDVKSGAHTNSIQIPITHVTLDVLHLF